MDKMIPFSPPVNGLPAVLAGLASVRQTGAHSWQAVCPAHPDTVPALSVTDTPDRILLYCHAGCAVENVVAALGLTMSSLFKSGGASRMNVVATYDYYDRSGNFVYQVARCEPKRFLQRQMDGDKWVWNIKGREPVPYRLPELLAAVERGETVYVAEGEKDVDNLVAIGLTATCNSGGAGKWTDVHSHYFRPGTNVAILPDNDAPGQKHARKVAELLCKRGAIVKVVGLPGLVDKGDISDWLADGHSKEELLGLVAESSWYQVTTAAVEEGLPAIYAAWEEIMQATRYAIDEDGYLCYKKYSSDGEIEEVPIANFVARPVREIIRDDGRDTMRTFEIEGLLAKGVPLPPVAVPAKDFAAMTWVPGAWGLGAAIEPGRGAADRVRHSIQSMAPGIPRQTVYTHLGWRKVGHKWVYLYAGGAVGADDLTVEPGEGLYRYVLSASPDREAAPDSLRCLGVAACHVTYPLAALIYLAPLCEPLRTAGIEPAFTLWLYGQSGTLKSTLSALFLSHYGRFEPKNLPGSFRDTENALERTGFLAKDTVLVVDDFHPQTDRQHARQMSRTAQMLLRGYGDRIGRTRMRADTSIREGFPPRGLLLVTGEDLPEAGQSTTARYLTVEVTQDAVNLHALTECQAKSHRFGSALRAYLEWLAPQLDDLPAILAAQFSQYRQKARVESGHGRLPEAVAWLYIGFAMFVTYAVMAAALPQSAGEIMLGDAWQVFISLGAEQERRIVEDKPVERFLSVLREVLASGAGYLIDLQEAGVRDAEPGFLGWQDNQWYYLLPETTYKAVSQFIDDQGGHFPVTARTLWQQLDAAGLIATEGVEGHIQRTVRERIGGQRLRVLKLTASAVKA